MDPQLVPHASCTYTDERYDRLPEDFPVGWPITSTRRADGCLVVGGVGVDELAERYGTPLYVFDEATLRYNARRFRGAFAAVYPRTRVVYAAKAYASPAILAVLSEEGLGLDVVSGGELYAGLKAGMPASAMTFHGSNKGAEELREALAAGIGLIAIDNDREIEVLSRLVDRGAAPQDVLVRLNPGVDVDTHHKMLTGALDSKFGFPIESGDAARAVERIGRTCGLNVVGYHAHVGSQVFDAGLVGRTIEAMMRFAVTARERFGVTPLVISPGGGFGVGDDASDGDVSVEAWAEVAATALRAAVERFDVPMPELVVEPGRAIVGPAAIALYRVGARKEIAGVRTYVSIDGGMADNIRPALYGAKYTATLANRDDTGATEPVTLAGKYCESGDVLIEQVALPALRPDDLVAVPMVGAYCLAMASNYNLASRPAVVVVRDGEDRLIRRRETYDDLLAGDLLPTVSRQSRSA